MKGGKREGAGAPNKYGDKETKRIHWTVPKEALPAIKAVLEQYRA